MDFELTDEQDMLRVAARALLSDHAADPNLWQRAARLGWLGLAAPEEYGGAGQGLVELALVAEEIGRAAAPGPFLPTATIALGLARGASERLRAAVLPDLAAGTAWATWAVAEPHTTWTDIRATARRDGDEVVIDGVKTAVQDADGARWLLVTALLDGTPVSFLVDRDAAGITVRRQKTLDLTRAFDEVRFENVRAGLANRVDGVRRMLDDASVLLAAETLGVLERMLDMTVDYTKTRVQFGRPIGSFQAVKHICATMAIQVHGIRAATYYAAMAADAGAADASRAACVAASYASAVAPDVAGNALQLHGGIGFTWEHDLHRYLRRAEVDGLLYGDAAAHRDRLRDLV